MAKNRTFGVVMVAGLIGAAIGLLFAPRTGKETRKDLRKKAGEAKEIALDAAEKTKAVVKENAEEVKGSLKRSAKEMSDLGEEAKIRASRIADDARATTLKVEDTTKRKLSEFSDKRPPIL